MQSNVSGKNGFVARQKEFPNKQTDLEKRKTAKKEKN